jgi:hypothetical protein
LIATAFLIVAHGQPELLARLVRRLEANETRCFIHLDARADIAAFRAALAGGPPHEFLESAERRPVHWCGFSTVEAIFRLLRRALEAPEGFERFWLLSGADYPIKPMATIAEAAALDTEAVQVDRELRAHGGETFDRFANQVYLGDRAWLNSRTGVPLIRKGVRVMELATRRRWPAGLKIFHGPSWWRLTRSAAQACVEACDSGAFPLDWFRLSRVPEEMVFQSLLMASPRASMIERDFSERAEPPMDDLQGTHFVDWRTPGPNQPAILTLEHLPRLLASDALFARKFDITRSAPLIGALDALHG